MAPGGMLLFNVDDGYLEGILRGYRSVRFTLHQTLPLPPPRPSSTYSINPFLLLSFNHYPFSSGISYIL